LAAFTVTLSVPLILIALLAVTVTEGISRYNHKYIISCNRNCGSSSSNNCISSYINSDSL
jgi:hypothetical protein